MGVASMTPELLAQIRVNCEGAEGRIPHFYLDTKGNVTIGIGHLVLSSDHAANLELEPESEIVSDYIAVKNSVPGLIASVYAPLCKTRMTDANIDALLDSDLAGCSGQLSHKFPGMDSFPDPSQAGLLDMGFNLGIGKLGSKFPTFCKAVDARDWATCAKECHRLDIPESRNVWTVNMFNEAAKLQGL